jgi:hypothetical protein
VPLVAALTAWASSSGPGRRPPFTLAPEPEPIVLDAVALALAERLRAAAHEPPSEAALGVDAVSLPALVAAGRAVRVGRDHYAAPGAIAGVLERLA